MLEGTGVALVTPFDSELKIDYKGLESLLKHTASGCDYYVVQGTTGESATTTFNEKTDLLNFVKANNPENLPIVFGIGGNNTGALIKNINDTDFTGVSAVLSVSPYYNKPSQRGIYEHFVKIADACPVPIIIYNVPGRTSSNITAATTIRLSKHDNIIGIKEASGDLMQCLDIIHQAKKDFLVISGDDLLTLPILSLGGVGVISVLANAFPDLFKQMINAFQSNDYKKASEVSYQMLEINPLMYEESNPVGVKEVLRQLGICNAYVRLPLVPASESLQSRIKSALKKIQ